MLPAVEVLVQPADLARLGAMREGETWEQSVKRRREYSGLSRTQFAQRAGVSDQTMLEIEKGVRRDGRRPDTIARIDALLDAVSPEPASDVVTLTALATDLAALRARTRR